MKRDYDQLAATLKSAADRHTAMRAFVDAAWAALNGTGVSWIGFYLPTEGGDEMVLGPSRNKPACSPIGLLGACGRAWLSRQPLIIRDVAELGEAYIACDPRDRSELVIPLVEASGASWGVLDVDSYDVGAFDERDLTGLTAALRAAGLTV